MPNIHSHTHTHRLFITNPSDTLALSVFYVFLKKHSRLTISKFREKEALQTESVIKRINEIKQRKQGVTLESSFFVAQVHVSD